MVIRTAQCRATIPGSSLATSRLLIW
jgi:hypothetical protein